jgi:hypothetical protein
LNLKLAELGLATLIVGLVFSHSLRAQIPTPTLSGAITGPSGTIVPNAKVSLKHLASRKSVETQTDPGGCYNAPNLTPGD